MSTKHISTTPSSSDIDYGIDRKALNIVKERFLQVNEARLQRAHSALSDRQRVFLELLPLLFHVNHPMLPGYITHQTPFGICNYTPTKTQIHTAQRLARSFSYRFQPPVDQQIQALYLMGSCGTVAQSDRSDIDIWVCHANDIDELGLLQLRQKAEAISEWAETIGVEAHCFLMDSDKFRLGERKNLSGEDCGSSQHFLLLDEFYRTSLLIAGRVPIWWLSPPDEDKNYDYYVSTLRDKRFVRAEDTLDFGGIDQIPAGEFVGAGIWQLYKGIDSPYKSTLKILLSEVYADQYPNIEPLSTLFKRAIYENRLDIDELDPYVIVFRRLENYLLNRKEYKRLELIRRCFYFKIGKPLTKPSSQKTKSWQRRLLEKLTLEWQWSREQLLNLDARDQWKVNRVISEQKDIVRELTNSYRYLLDFARRTKATALINSQDMTVLGRKLYAAFERKAGKIEWINPGISANLAEEKLSFYQFSSEDNKKSQWAVTTDPLLPKDTTRHKGLKRCDNLITLLAWCHFNGLLDSATRCNIVAGEHEVNDFELLNLIRSLRQVLPVASQYTDHADENHDRFSRAMRPTQLQLFINIGTDPLGHMRSQGIERLSDQTDSLGYSGMRENLVINIEQVLVNSWGELSTQCYDGESALLRCIKDYLQMLPPGSGKALPKLDIRCFCASRSSAITMRIEELFRDLIACYYSGTRPSTSRYIIQIQHDFYVIQFIDLQPCIENVGNQKEMLDYLSHSQAHYSPIVFDRFCLADSPLQAISQHCKADTIQVFYQCSKKMAKVYVNDEKGSLNVFTAPCIDKNNFLTPLDLFIQSTLFRQNSEALDLTSDLNDSLQENYKAIEYFEISSTRNEHSIIRSNPINHDGCPNFFNVQAIGNRDTNNALSFNIYCDQHEFTEQEYGDELFNAVATFILHRRTSNERYPCYITDLDLSRSDEKQGKNIQTGRYLHYKKQLEQALNSALLQV